MVSLKGGCSCGACRYVLDFSVLPVCYACYCLDCQTMTGSAFSLHAVVPMSRFEVTGVLQGWSPVDGVGARTTYHACAECKTRIYSTNEGRAGLAILRTGTFDDSRDVVPLVHMWAKRKQAWIGLPADAQVYDEAIPPELLQAFFSINLDLIDGGRAEPGVGPG